MQDIAPTTIAAIGGLAGGIVLGVAARWGRFCTLGSIEDALFGADTLRLRTWGLAIAIAITGSFALDHAGVVQIEHSFYLAGSGNLLATVVGGLLFGFGMALVGTCGYGTLARLGGGDLKSLVTFLVMGVTAYATMRGAASFLRTGLFPRDNDSIASTGIAHLLSNEISLSPHTIAYLIAFTIAALCIYRTHNRMPVRNIVVALMVGGTVTSGWYVTGYLAADPFDPYPLESYTFAAPLGDTIIYFMTMSGSTLKFGIGATIGVVIGAALTCLWRREFYWEACDDARELKRQLVGGVLMGFGSVLAIGCTIGQGISAASTLALSAPIALISIFLGAWVGLKLLIEGDIFSTLKTLIAK